MMMMFCNIEDEEKFKHVYWEQSAGGAAGKVQRKRQRLCNPTVKLSDNNCCFKPAPDWFQKKVKK
jgi:hypothetical protein